MKNILSFLLLCISFTAYTQTNDRNAVWSKTEKNFNARYISHRHTVYLEKGNRMDVELYELASYDMLGNVDTILRTFKKEVDKLKDSLRVRPSDNVRIDLAYTNPDYKMMRITKYPAAGDMFVDRKGVIAPLKIDQDTIRILIQKRVTRKFRNGFVIKTYTPAQLTFILNNYTDIDELIGNKTIQQHIDTMRQASGKYASRSIWSSRSTIVYRPYDTIGRRRFFMNDWLVSEINPEVNNNVNKTRLTINANLGVGIVRNTLAPVADLGLELRDPWTAGLKEYRLFGIYASPYFVFERQANNTFKTHMNFFINGELGSRYDGKLLSVDFQRITLGGGYLLNPDGNYFKNTTAKLFMNFTLTKGITISPEVIATNDFTEFFPGITLKVF
jgi:hypothetical protein